MLQTSQDLYAILGVNPRCSFEDLKQAYYRRAKECHPDRFEGDRAKEEEFKLLVHAFDVLSDPPQRREYDERLELADDPSAVIASRDGGTSVMDTVADDILEELIVGNNLPPNATLQTLMLDLQRTMRFVTFREAKNLYYRRGYGHAAKLLRKLVRWSPHNILYHYYLGESSVRLRKYGTARRHFRICLQIGSMRQPLQYLERIRRRLHQLQEKRGTIGRMVAKLSPFEPRSLLPPDQQMTAQLNRAVEQMLKGRLRNGGKQQKRLDTGRPR